jgi:Tfp pilus assembly protein PilV
MPALKTKLKGSTLVEVLVAFIIVMLVFSLSVTIITKTYQSFPGMHELRILSISQKIRDETERKKSWYAQSYKIPGYQIEKAVRKSPFSKNILVLEVIAHPDQKEGKKIQYNYILPIR